VLRLVVKDVAPLAERRGVLGRIVHRIVVAVARRQHDTRRPPGGLVVDRLGPSPNRATLAAPPRLPLVVPPSSVAEVHHHAAVRPAAALASAASAAKPD